MRRSLWLCVVLGGCGFHSSAGPDDGAPADAAPVLDASTDGAVDASRDASNDALIDAMAPPETCWQRWLDHSVALQAVAPLTSLSTAGIERDPWISEDGLRLYFWRQGATGTADGYLATRALPTDPFLSAAKLPGLSLPDRDESRMAFTRDELVIVVSSNLGGASQFDVRSATRNNRNQAFPVPLPDHLGAVNTANTQHYDPFLSGDGLRLYLAPAPTGLQQHIAMASRTALGADFTPAALVGGVNTTEAMAGDADPALSPDERVIVFSSNRSGGVGNGDLYYATRTNADLPFGAPLPIPTVNSASGDGDPMLTADGCTLYFASLRPGGAGDFDLYTAAVVR